MLSKRAAPYCVKAHPSRAEELPESRTTPDRMQWCLDVGFPVL